jgi:alkanesulfonate monooxygenase SsuD/methylene tetrahydromethanopterin reductase-like flavin-dependent oxidoreductase (luciferase family)
LFSILERRFPNRNKIALTSIAKQVGRVPSRLPLARDRAMWDSRRMRRLTRNALSLGLFGANCSGGLATSRFPGRWVASWDNNLALARMADAAGLEFMLPLGRWKGYGGQTNHNGESFETLTWASGLLAATSRIMCFGTVHVTAINPVVAAKQMVTADHIGHGRFGLNVVCGWYQDEFDMLGVDLGSHDARYELGQEWIDIVTRAWSADAPFDYDGRFFRLKGTVMNPKPVGGERPMVVCAGASEDGRRFAARNGDMLFNAIRAGLDEVPGKVAALKALAAGYGRDVGAFTNVYVVCRKSRKEAEEFHHYYAVEMADEEAAETMVVERGLDKPGVPEERRRAFRVRAAGGNGAWPIVGDPDDCAAEMQRLSGCGIDALAMGLANYLDDLPFLREALLPRLERMGLRRPA